MRRRKEIEDEIGLDIGTRHEHLLILELVLDIRELLEDIRGHV